MKRNKALSYLFRTHLAITISAKVSGRLGAMPRTEIFYSSGMNCISMDSIIEVFYYLNKMSVAIKHITDSNFVFQ